MKELVALFFLKLAGRAYSKMAKKCFIKIAIMFYPTHDTYNYAAGIAVNANLLDLAINCCQQSIKKHENSYAYLGLGSIMLQQEKYEKAENYINKSLLIDPEFVLAKTVLIPIYLEQKKYNEAEILALSVRHNQTVRQKVEMLLAVIYLNKKDLTKAKEILDYLVNKPETKNYAIYYLAKYYYLEGDFIKAKEKIDLVKDKIDKEDFMELKNLIYEGYHNNTSKT